MTVIKRYILPSLLVLILCVVGVGFNSQPVQASSQVIFAGNVDPLNKTNATTEYNCIAHGEAWQSNSLIAGQCVTTAGKIKNLYVELFNPADGTAMAPGAGDDTYTFTLMVNGVASALTCAIVGAATSNSDVSNQIDVVAGNNVMLRVVSSGSPANAPYAQWSFSFAGTTAKESLTLGFVQTQTATTHYTPVGQANTSGRSNTETQMRQIIPTSGKLKNLWVRGHASPGGGTTAYSFTLRLGNAASSYVLGDTTLTCTMTAANYAAGASDVANEVTVAAGDIVTLKIIPLNTPTGNPICYWGMTFVSDTDGESIVMGGTPYNQSTSAVSYFDLSAKLDGQAWYASEFTGTQLGQVCVLKNLYVRLATAPANGAGTQSYTFVPRVNAASPAGGLSVTISEASTTGSDTANSITLVAGDNVAFMSTPSGTPANAAGTYWGVVCYIAPPTSGRSFGIIVGKR